MSYQDTIKNTVVSLLKMRYPKKEKLKKVLIECLKIQGLIDEMPKMETITLTDTCKLCNSSNFVFSNHEKICENCGDSVTSSEGNKFKTYKQNISLLQGTFIQPGILTMTVVKDGKRVNRDLAKVNTWLDTQSLTVEERRIGTLSKKIQDLIIDLQYNENLVKKANEYIIPMWYNLISSKKDVTGDTLKSLMVLVVYYGFLYAEEEISLQRLSKLTGVSLNVILSNNFILKDLFKNTSFEKIISLKIGTISDITLSKKMEKNFKVVKNDLIGYLSNPISDKQTYGIIYFLSTKMLDEKYTLNELSKKSGISPPIISAEAKKIERFYGANKSRKFLD